MASTARPFLMFTGDAQQAMDLYTSLFPDSHIVGIEHYAADQSGPEGSVKVATFTLCGREFMCSDSPVKHSFSFTPSSSIFVDCASREELDHAFEVLSTDGEILMPVNNYGFSQGFAWINDRFGVSWQLNLPD